MSWEDGRIINLKKGFEYYLFTNIIKNISLKIKKLVIYTE